MNSADVKELNGIWMDPNLSELAQEDIFDKIMLLVQCYLPENLWTRFTSQFLRLAVDYHRFATLAEIGINPEDREQVDYARRMLLS